MLRVISSGQTVLMKFVFVPLWVLGFGAGTLMAWMGKYDLPGHPTTTAENWALTLIWLGGTAFLFALTSPLKRVRVDDRFLLVSNYQTEYRVPLDTITDVTEQRWLNIHPVTVHLSHDTPFGRKIRFMPTSRMFAFWSSHPIVAELQQLAREARLRGTGETDPSSRD